MKGHWIGLIQMVKFVSLQLQGTFREVIMLLLLKSNSAKYKCITAKNTTLCTILC
jgi:hypothetical protein